MSQLVCSAAIVQVLQNEGRTILILDQTVFYPQGGGQPYDMGSIKTEDNSMAFKVEEARFIEGAVHHIGTVESGEPLVYMSVICTVDAERRTLYSRLHSAGHVIDLALKELRIHWLPGKGYHFPQGPYVEYEGSLDSVDVESLKASIEQKCHEITSRNIETRLVFDANRLQHGKPMRTVYYGDFGIACGGTHVGNLQDIGNVTIRKIKKEKDTIRVSYEV